MMLFTYTPSFRCNRVVQHFQKNLAMEGGPRFSNSHFTFLPTQYPTNSQSKWPTQRFPFLLEVGNITPKRKLNVQFLPLKVCYFLVPYPTLSLNFDHSQSEIFALFIVFFPNNPKDDHISYFCTESQNQSRYLIKHFELLNAKQKVLRVA